MSEQTHSNLFLLCILLLFVTPLVAFWWLLFFSQYFSCDSRVSDFLGCMKYRVLCGGTIKSG